MEGPNMRQTKLITLLAAMVILAEIGVAMVLLNARPQAPLGFWLWFAGIGVLAPLYAVWLYRRCTGRKAD